MVTVDKTTWRANEAAVIGLPFDYLAVPVVEQIYASEDADPQYSFQFRKIRCDV
jgi:hypothetical protein